MPTLADTPNVPVSCPKCGEMLEVEFSQLQQDPHLTCSYCEHHFEVNDEELRKIERSYSDSAAALKENPDMPTC